MSKTKVLALSLLLSLLLVPDAYAKTESFILAADIVKSFNAEVSALLPKSLESEPKRTLTKSIKDNKRGANSKIKWLRRSEEPSPSRFRRLYKAKACLKR
jgi:hypothetical protein